jgi:hypothetical protein
MSPCNPPVFPLFPCTASSHLSPVVLSRTGGLRGLPPIGWLTQCGPHRPVPFCRSGSGLVAPVRARGLAGRGLIGARTSVRRDLIGRILCVPTGVCCRGDWEWQRNSRQGKRGRGYYKVVHTVCCRSNF